jgi:hypothetical protein
MSSTASRVRIRTSARGGAAGGFGVEVARGVTVIGLRVEVALGAVAVGAGVSVGGTGVAVGTGVFVGGTSVAVGGSGVAVGMAVFVGGTGVEVGGCVGMEVGGGGVDVAHPASHAIDTANIRQRRNKVCILLLIEIDFPASSLPDS